MLECLVESGYIFKENVVIDYGCGKGRVGFFLNNQLGCKVLGVDFDARMCKIAHENLENYIKCCERQKGDLEKEKIVNDKYDIDFLCESAERYEVQDADRFYFFNPFSVEVLQSVIGKIKRSYYEKPREMQLFFYYPSDEYVSYLMQVQELCFLDEIDCLDLFEGEDPREKILIFEMV